MSLTVATFAITAALCYLIYHLTMWHWGRRHLYSMASKFEGPTVLPVIGNAHMFIGNSEHILNSIYNLSKSYPSLHRVWLGPVLVFNVYDPEQMKTICMSQKALGKSKLLTEYSKPWVGTGLLTAPVPKWKVHRKLIQPTFNPKILDSFVAIFSAQSKILTEQMELNSGGQEFEVFDLISRCTLDMVCETSMGVRMGAQTDKNCYYVEAIQEFLAGFCKRMFSPWLYPDFIFYRTQIGRDQNKWVKYLHEFTNNVIRQKKKQLLESHSQPATVDDEDYACESNSRRKAFLDHLLQLPNDSVSLSDKDLREEVDTIVVAGTDTSSLTISYVMLMLASHPEVQEKVYRELYDIYGEEDIEKRPVTSKDLSRMKYLERVIKETLRLFPPAPTINREVMEDLEVGDKTIPKGSTIAFIIFAIQRNEKYWPDPLKFDPDRFLPEEIAKRHPYTFMAFSGGPRNCIGYNYALMVMKTMLATVLRRFVLKKDDTPLVKDIRLTMEITLKPVDPIKIRIERRIVK